MTQGEFWLNIVIPVMENNRIGNYTIKDYNGNPLNNTRLKDIFTNKDNIGIYFHKNNDFDSIGHFNNHNFDLSMDYIKSLNDNWNAIYTDIELFIRNSKIENFLN